MRLPNIVRLRLQSLLSRRRLEQELDEEYRYHLERQIKEEIQSGATPEDARYAALRSIGAIEQWKEECRDARGVNVLDNAAQDLRFAIRQLRKNPEFACTAIFVLALGISAAVTIFGFIDAGLIKPLPYRDQQRLVAVFDSESSNARSLVSYANFADWKHLNRAFASIDAYAVNGGFTLTTRTGAEEVPGTRVSAGFFRTLGVRSILGRDFRPTEDSPGARQTVVLSYDAWQKRFGANPDVLGKIVTLNGAPTTIIGVLPRDFHFAPYGGAEFWGTLRSSDACERERSCLNLIAIARLRDGVSIKAAASEMQSIARLLRAQYPDANSDVRGATLVPLRELIIGDVGPVLLMLFAGAGLLLLIACFNVTALLFARSDKRQHEIAVRGAMGVSSSRLFQQFAVEGLVLATLGGLFALFFADLSIRLLVDMIPAEKLASMPYLKGIGLHPLSIILACSITVLAGILFAVIPIARTPRSEMVNGLKEGARGFAGTTWRRFGSNLVVVEVAIAMMLMVGAGLLGKSLYLLMNRDVGFTADHLAKVQITWSPGTYDKDQEDILLAHRIVDRVSKLPGVRSIGLSLASPIDSSWGTGSFHVAGRPNHGENNAILNREVSSGYFATLQARLVRGRYFREDDDASRPRVAIVNRALANKYFRGEDAIGKQIYYDWQPKSLMQIVGIVDDIREGPLEAAFSPAIYVPYNQIPCAWPVVLVRSSQSAASILPEITRAIHQVDPFLSVSAQQTMIERIDQSPSAYLHRSSALVVGAFAASAFVLSVIGLYGVISYSANQRRREIGIRIALGAERTAVYRLVLSEAGRLALFGLVIGLACSLLAATMMRSLLFGVRSWDMPTFLVVAMVLGISALLASYMPARRAAATDPVEALRTE